MWLNLSEDRNIFAAPSKNLGRVDSKMSTNDSKSSVRPTTKYLLTENTKKTKFYENKTDTVGARIPGTFELRMVVGFQIIIQTI